MTTIFIVEDHAIMRSSLIALFESESDFSICGEAQSGLEALEKLETVKPDLIIIDVSMPGMDGMALLKEIRARWPDLSCVMLSGHDASVYSEQVILAGAATYISKSQVASIVPEIRRVLEKRL